MPSTPSGYVLPAIYFAVPGTTIRAEQHNRPLEDLAAGVNDSVARDGSRPMTGNLPMSGRKITGLAAGTAAADAVRFDQLPRTSGWTRSLANLTLAANQFPYATSSTAAAAANLTPFARTILDDANAAAVRTTLGLGVGATSGAQSQASWNAGTSNDESVISPAKLRAAIDDRNVPRTRAWLHVWLHNGAANIIDIRGRSGISSVSRLEAGKYRVVTSITLPEGYAVNANTSLWFTGAYQSGNDSPLMIRPINSTTFDVWAMDGDTNTIDIGAMMLTVTF